MDNSGVAVMLGTIAQQQTSMASDLSAMRTDVTRALTRLETVDSARADVETRLRVIEQRPSTVDLETRIRRLEAWRYSLPTAVVLGIGSAVASVIAVIHH